MLRMFTAGGSGVSTLVLSHVEDRDDIATRCASRNRGRGQRSRFNNWGGVTREDTLRIHAGA